MHQMCISTNQISSVMLRSKKLQIRKKKYENYEKADKNQTECHEIDPNLWKDRAMPEGDNPLFWDEFIRFTFLHSSIQIVF
jgi:hypothetical protein